MKLQTTKSQTIALMMQELTAMQQQCEDYRHAVSTLSKQVSALAAQVHQANLHSEAREERLLQQLNDLQTTLGQWQ